MGLQVNLADVQSSPIVCSDNLRGDSHDMPDIRVVHGQSLSMMYATLPGGYYTRPHVCGSEQLAYVVTGTILVYMFEHEYELHQGDFLHVPRNTVYWTRNKTTGAATVLVTQHVPNLRHDTPTEQAISLLRDEENGTSESASSLFWLSDRYLVGEDQFPKADETNPYWISAGRIQPSEHKHMRDAGGLFSLFVHGHQSNLLVATRPAGYHSKPHVHDCEQLNYLASGRLWIFVRDEAYLLKPGDLMRVPANEPHWAWNDGDEECALIEAHSPVLDASLKDHSVALYPADRGQTYSEVHNYFVDERISSGEQNAIDRYYRGVN